MKRGSVFHRVAIALACLWTGAAQATVIWDESTNGDLSGNGLSPTPISVSMGVNRILGSTGNSGQGVDRDYFRITVPPGAALTAITLLDNTSVSGGASYIGIQAGPQVTVTTTGGGAENLVGSGHYGNDQIGSDLLPSIKLGPPGPYAAGTYSVWVQDTGGPATYGFDFVVSPVAGAGGNARVPALPGWGMGLLALLLAAAFWKVNREH
jgi:hypothetical protein